MKKANVEKLNKILNEYGLTVVYTEDLEELKNMVQSLTDYINIKEGDEE